MTALLTSAMFVVALAGVWVIAQPQDLSVVMVAGVFGDCITYDCHVCCCVGRCLGDCIISPLPVIVSCHVCRCLDECITFECHVGHSVQRCLGNCITNTNVGWCLVNVLSVTFSCPVSRRLGDCITFCCHLSWWQVTVNCKVGMYL